MKTIVNECSVPQGTIHRSGRVENGTSVLDTQAPAKAFQVGLRTMAIAITLAALGLAWPLPVRAQTLHTITIPDPVVDPVTGASAALTAAIQTFAASPTAANAAAITTEQTHYNEAVSMAAGMLGNVAPL